MSLKRPYRPITLAAIVLLAATVCSGQALRDPLCGVISGAPALRKTLDQPGGIYMPSRGVFRILVIFASFPDDESPHPFWPAHAPPAGMDQFIDPDTATHSAGSFNLTNYFRQMSLGALQVVGDAVWVETNHSEEEYRANGSFGRANHDLFVGRADSAIDFSAYDHWTMNNDYVQTPGPDGQVDMIVVVWRTTMWGYLGQSLLAPGRPPDTLDNVRIAMGYPGYSRWDSVYHYDAGSGVTCEYPATDAPQKAMRTMVHEVSHWLLGKDHPYNTQTLTGKHEYWGMLCTGHRLSSCVNAYERERLGWITVPELPLDSVVMLPDYLTAGAAYKYHPVQGDEFEYLYFENHQLASPFDDVTANRDDRGLWVLHQDAPYNDLSDFLKILPSDGFWSWYSFSTSSACFGQSLPVFTRGGPALGGLSHRDELSTPTSAVQWMFLREDSTGQPECGSFLGGEGFEGAFSPRTERVFSPASNPPARTWNGIPIPLAVEIVNDSAGVLKLQTYGQPLAASPARRYLAEDPLIDGSFAVGLWLGWGAQWTQGQPLESDIQLSELQRRVGPDTAWTTIYTGGGFSWRDTSINYSIGGTIPAVYRVRVRDTQGKYSNWSLLFRTLIGEINSVQTRSPVVPDQVRLEQNYPNPFNPTTVVSSQLTVASNVKLTIYDILGREVDVLVNDRREPGRYQDRWNAEGNASGVYICRLTTHGTVLSIKMLYLR